MWRALSRSERTGAGGELLVVCHHESERPGRAGQRSFVGYLEQITNASRSRTRLTVAIASTTPARASPRAT